MLGFSPGGNMQKINEQNRGMLKKSGKNKLDIQTGEKGKLIFKEPTKEEYEKWKREFTIKKKKERINKLILFSILIIGVVIAYYLTGLFD